MHVVGVHKPRININFKFLRGDKYKSPSVHIGEASVAAVARSQSQEQLGHSQSVGRIEPTLFLARRTSLRFHSVLSRCLFGVPPVAVLCPLSAVFLLSAVC